MDVVESVFWLKLLVSKYIEKNFLFPYKKQGSPLKDKSHETLTLVRLHHH
jgi:hypothetical protein